ncbi:mavicyanin-like [Ziziphus jujuba]|uniref:Mavicyanin-like n=1 Tax=Ziziphus jujuba TaxID=326968 RepID=A0ABM4AA68_ZIZJJ|nr:mavicyanin-like [Ziziphus jujuba]
MGITEGSLLVILLLISAPLMVYGVEHVVGDSSGWTNANVNYETWASSRTFAVGDTLLFTYGSNHKVDIVNESDYTACNTSKALSTYDDGNTTIPLTVVGPMYFLCPIANHCSEGQKLAINVVAPNTTTPVTPSPPPPPSTTATPPTSSRASKIMCNTDSNLMLGIWLVLLTMFGFMG